METLQPFTDRLSPDQLKLYLAIVDEVERYRNLSVEEKKQLVQDIMDRPYLDLLCDWAFKHVFGGNLDLLEMLLRDILQMDLSVEKPLANEIDKFRPDDRNIIMDVICQLRQAAQAGREVHRRACRLRGLLRQLQDAAHRLPPGQDRLHL